MNLKFLLAAISISFSICTQAVDDNLCGQALTKPTYLQDVGKTAAEAKKRICSAETQMAMDLEYLDFLDDIKYWFEPYGGFEENKSVVGAIKSQITSANSSVVVDLSLEDLIQVGQESFKPRDEGQCVRISGAPDCIKVLEEFIQLYGEIQSLQADPRRRETLKNLRRLRSDWDPFLEHMKGQTWLELLVNRQAYKNNSDTFAGPPSSQWIVLHPTVLIENVSAATDGQNTQEALGIEIIGMNWWKQEKWYIPSGASALAIYSDRADVDDVGYGMAFHFQSNYTIGYTSHNGENGFFVSMDLIKLFQDKKKVFESYKSAFD